MEKLYVQYGCGLTAPTQWVNFDVSPTLRIQKLPVLGAALKGRLNAAFPSNVLYGDIIKGLPLADNSCDGLFCSHTLEHLSLNDFERALKNSYKILKPGGIFRCIVPDLEAAARNYLDLLANGNAQASADFMYATSLGITDRPKGVKGLVGTFWGNSKHLWMWDTKSLAEKLKNAGFTQVRVCNFNDSDDEMFKYVEEEGRFYQAAAIECRK